MQGEAYFLDGAPALSFGGSKEGRSTLAAGWINVFHPKNGVLLSVWSLDESAPAGSAVTLLVNYSLPVDDDLGDSYQNVPAAVEVSQSGSYVALCSWGTQERLPGQEQLQLVEVPDVSNPAGAAPSVPVAIMTSGSIFSCAVADDGFGGAHLVGGGKAVHANQMGNGGYYYYAHYTASSQRSATPTHAGPRSTGGHDEPTVLESMRWQRDGVIKTQSLSARSFSLEDPVVDLALIAEINSASPNLSWQAAANYERFGNMTRQQLQSGLLRTGPWSNAPPVARADRDPAKAEKVKVAAKRANSRIPESFDARQQWPTCVGPIRDQARCGSCWAFAAAEALSDRVCISSSSKEHADLSTDYLIVCDDAHDRGCQGGFLQYVWDFLVQDGDPSEACFPYTAGMGTPSSTCQQRCTNSSGGNAFQKATAVNGTVLRLEDEEQIQVAIMEAGPVQAAFSVWSDFMQYKGGVYSHVSGLFEGGHSVKIVGWGVQPGTGTNSSVPCVR